MTQRKNFRLSNQINELLESAAVDLDMTQTEIVEYAIFSWLNDNEEFVHCSICNTKMVRKDLLTVSSGSVMKQSCKKCKAEHFIDCDDFAILKTVEK